MTSPTAVVVIEPDGTRPHPSVAADDRCRPASHRSRPPAFDGVHAVVYPPTNPAHDAGPGTAPVIITVHGGPTSQHSRTLSAVTAFFTSRGFAVAAVDYRGSTGYGRPVSRGAQGHWAELDIADAITVAAGLLADGTAGAALISGGTPADSPCSARSPPPGTRSLPAPRPTGSAT